MTVQRVNKKGYATWKKINPFYIKKAMGFVIVNIVRSWVVPSQVRVFLLRIIGAKFTDPKSVFIGVDITFDFVKEGRVFLEKMWQLQRV